VSDGLPRVVYWRRAVLAAPGLTDAQKVVAFALAEHMNRDGGSCWPSVETLGVEVTLTRRSVQRALAALQAAGWIDRQLGVGRGRSSHYRASFPDTERVSDETPFTEEKRRRLVHEKASSCARKGVTRDAQGLQEVERERGRPPRSPPGGQPRRRADADEDLAYLDTDFGHRPGRAGVAATEERPS